MNILLAGGTGFIGKYLIQSLTQDGHSVTVLHRNVKQIQNRLVSYQKWDGKEMPLAVKVAVYDGVINLVGASIAEKKWTDAYKKELIESRVNASQACVNYIQGTTIKPKFFLNASAVGYYGGDNPNETDENAANGTDFMADLCQKWEDASKGAGIRTVQMRIGVVLGKGGGALAEMIPLYQKHIGGRLASGKQGMSWIHISDLVRSIHFLIENTTIEGPINLCAGWVEQNLFSQALEKALNKKNPFFVPKFVLNLVLGERAIIVWGGQKAVPSKLKTAGFSYKYPEINAALQDVVKG